MFVMILLVAFESLAVTTAMPTVATVLDGAHLYQLAFAGAIAAGIVGMVVGGAWCDRSGPRTPLTLACAAFAAGLAVAALTPSMEILVGGARPDDRDAVGRAGARRRAPVPARVRGGDRGRHRRDGRRRRVVRPLGSPHPAHARVRGVRRGTRGRSAHAVDGDPRRGAPPARPGRRGDQRVPLRDRRPPVPRAAAPADLRGLLRSLGAALDRGAARRGDRHRARLVALGVRWCGTARGARVV